MCVVLGLKEAELITRKHRGPISFTQFLFPLETGCTGGYRGCRQSPPVNKCEYSCFQITDPPCSIPWLSPKSLTRSHLAVIGLDAYLWYHLTTSVGLAWVEFQESGLPLVALS